MARMTGGRAVVEFLKAQGVDMVFGIISIHTLELFNVPEGKPGWIVYTRPVAAPAPRGQGGRA